MPLPTEFTTHAVTKVRGVMSVTASGNLRIQYQYPEFSTVLTRQEVEHQTIRPERLAFLNSFSPTPSANVSSITTAILNVNREGVMSVVDGNLVISFGDCTPIVLSREQVESQTTRSERLAFLNAHAPAPSGGSDASAPSNVDDDSKHLEDEYGEVIGVPITQSNALFLTSEVGSVDHPTLGTLHMGVRIPDGAIVLKVPDMGAYIISTADFVKAVCEHLAGEGQ